MASIHYAPASSPTWFAAILASTLAGLRKLTQALKHRRDAALLANMDERMLRDIGLTRSDLRDAYAEPLWRDPTDILAGRAQDRRRHRSLNRIQDGNAFFASPPLAPHDGFTVPDTNRPSHQTI